MRVFLVFSLVTVLIVTAYFTNKFNISSHKGVDSTTVTADDEFVVNDLSSFASDREVFISDIINLPLSGSAPTTNVKHTIAIDEIRQGCFRQDCIPSIEEPIFTNISNVKNKLKPGSLGVSLIYKNKQRFYPFPMLETHELVNDTVAGDELLISYCPLCGTGVVFERNINGEVFEFGVSGMLWQSNLLMYNRADSINDRNLWSQVLGEAVVGESSGKKLKLVPSDITTFDIWSKTYPDGQVLDGEPKDPYAGRYYDIARNFDPNYDEINSLLKPMDYIYGIEVNGTYKAYKRSDLSVGTFVDQIGTEKITIQNDNNTVIFSNEFGEIIPDVEGFWFSWIAAHPDTLIWDNIGY